MAGQPARPVFRVRPSLDDQIELHGRRPLGGLNQGLRYVARRLALRSGDDPRHRGAELCAVASRSGRRGRRSGRGGWCGHPKYMVQLREKFGLDQPVDIQLAVYLKRVATFDLGYSFRHGMSVTDLILSRLGPTLLLMLTVFAISVAVASRSAWSPPVISTASLTICCRPLPSSPTLRRCSGQA